MDVKVHPFDLDYEEIAVHRVTLFNIMTLIFRTRPTNNLKAQETNLK